MGNLLPPSRVVPRLMHQCVPTPNQATLIVLSVRFTERQYRYVPKCPQAVTYRGRSQWKSVMLNNSGHGRITGPNRMNNLKEISPILRHGFLKIGNFSEFTDYYCSVLRRKFCGACDEG